MKFLLIIVAVFIANCVNANDFQALRAAQMLEVQQLPNLTKAYFSVSDNDGLTLEDLLDRERHNQHLALNRALVLAIDSHSNLSQLTEYGVEQVDEHTYQIVYQSTPQWARLSDVFAFLRVANGLSQFSKKKLKQMGLSETDLVMLNKYLLENPIELMLHKNALEHVRAGRKSLVLKQSDSAKAAYAEYIGLQMEYGAQNTWYEWVKGLMSRFSRVKQQVIFEFGKAELMTRVTQISSTTMSEQKSLLFAERIMSKELDSIFLRGIKRIEAVQEGWEK